MYMYIGIVRQNITADGSGRWNQHIGQERGNARIEVRQMKTGRPWSDMAVSNVVQLPALGNPSIDQMNTAQDHIYGWATPGATVKVHAHGVFIRDIGTDASGRWWTHLGFERGNTIVEAQQRVVGRPWSGWSRMVVQQLPQMPPPSINYIDTSHDWVSGRGEPGATVKVHVHGVVIRDVGVDRSR